MEAPQESFCNFGEADRLIQGKAADSILRGDLIERAAEAGLRSIFVGFETLTPDNLRRSNKRQNLGRDYKAVADRLHGLGIMIDGSFVFGMDDDGEDVFRRTVDWAIEHGITTATFHIQTPYPGTGLHARMEREGRIVTRDWNLYDTRHVVYLPARLRAEALKAGYDWAYREVLPVGRDCAGVAASWHREAPGEAPLLCCGMEEVRTAVGLDHSRVATQPRDAVAGGGVIAGNGWEAERAECKESH